MIKSSSNLGNRPPADVIVLFDGSSLQEWKLAKKNGKASWQVLKSGAMEVGKGSIVTKKEFKDFKLHLEFRTPFMPTKRGQKHGNSGVYLQGRYEVQVLDSFGLDGKDNECGGTYKIAAPIVNACLPPLEWQTYDIIFHATKFNGVGKKVGNAVITLKLNGILIHDSLELLKVTGGPISKDESKPGRLMLQDHKDPVQYRNIWIQPL